MDPRHLMHWMVDRDIRELQSIAAFLTSTSESLAPVPELRAVTPPLRREPPNGADPLVSAQRCAAEMRA